MSAPLSFKQFVVGPPPDGRSVSQHLDELAATAAPRLCECCNRRMPRSKRSDARTCSKRCRQRKSRALIKQGKASRSTRAARHLLTPSARRRALEGVAID
jgi:hypothetical protein